MARPKKDDSEKAFRYTISITRKDLDQLESYCQRHELQPSMSMVIRKALEEYYKNHPLD